MAQAPLDGPTGHEFEKEEDIGGGMPSRKAIDACVDQLEGATCQVEAGIEGVCRYTEDKLFLACRAHSLQDQDEHDDGPGVE